MRIRMQICLHPASQDDSGVRLRSPPNGGTLIGLSKMHEELLLTSPKRGIAPAMCLLLVSQEPIFLTDLYHYIWDGRVQAAGINPYVYVPADPMLTHCATPLSSLTSIGPTAP